MIRPLGAIEGSVSNANLLQSLVLCMCWSTANLVRASWAGVMIIGDAMSIVHANNEAIRVTSQVYPCWGLLQSDGKIIEFGVRSPVEPMISAMKEASRAALSLFEEEEEDWDLLGNHSRRSPANLQGSFN